MQRRPPTLVYIQRVTPTGTPTPNEYDIRFTGGAGCANCNWKSLCIAAGTCCDNLEPGSDPPCAGLPGCLTPTPTPTLSYQPPETCSWDNHECNPVCDIHNFEGGDMWKRIDTRGYENVIVEFELFAEGLSAIPHGRRMPGSEYKPELEGNRHLPYLVCKDADPEKLNACIDCFMMEQVFEVWYTTDYSPPYKMSLFPAFRTEQDQFPGGILNWKLAKAIPRSVLRAKYASWEKVTLDFFAQDATDDNPNFGVWFRCLLDSEENKVYIRNVVMRGQVPTPTPTQ